MNQGFLRLVKDCGLRVNAQQQKGSSRTARVLYSV
jgi:hypothetical protein